MKNLTKLVLILSSLLLSCSRVQTLNLKTHDYSDRPKNIIWFQVAGLQEEHLAMIKFSVSKGHQAASFEKMSCMGKAWNYNLYGLRPSAGEGFLSQIVGSKNITGTCRDFSQKPFWKYVNEAGYKVGIFESLAGKRSLSYSKDCAEGRGFLGQSTLWKMEHSDSNKLFHYLGNEKFNKDEVYYDKSCKKGTCFATIFDNIKSIWTRFKKEPGLSIFIVRDFSYLKALKSKNISKAREVLLELDKSIGYLFKEMKRDNQTLFLVTSSGPLNFEMPKEGKEWFEFERSGKHVLFRNTSLLSPVMSYGAGAENFCGIFEESEMVNRIFWSTNKKAWNILKGL